MANKFVEDIDIEASIKYHLVCRKSWDINDALALICAIIYPFSKDYNSKSLSCIDGIKRVLCKYKVEITRLSFDGVKEYFKQQIMPQIGAANRDQLLKIFNGDKFKYDKENGVIYVNYADCVIERMLETYRDKAYLYNGYGTELYTKAENIDNKTSATTYDTHGSIEIASNRHIESIIDTPIEEVQNDDSNTIHDDTNVETTMTAEFVSEQSDNADKIRIRKTRNTKDISYDDLRPFIDIHNKLKESRGGNLTYRYIWQWRISNSEYISIKKLLEANKGQIERLFRSEHPSVIFIIVAYIAEYFKREWNAHSSKEKVWEAIGIKNSKAIVEKYYVHKSDQIVYQHDNSGSHEWLDALYYEGGLPINYIVESVNEAKEQGGRGLYIDIFKDLYRHPDVAADKFATAIRRKSLQSSYEKEGSIYHFIQSIKEPKNGLQNTFSNDDLDKEPFNSLRELLQKGYESIKQEPKFRIKYRVWKYRDEFVVRRSIAMRENAAYHESPADAISLKRINKQWKIENKPYTFWLCIKVNDINYGKMFHYVASKRTCVDGEILYRNGINDTERMLPPLTSTKDKIEVCYLNSDKSIVRTIQTPTLPANGYIEFRQISSFEWVDRSGVRDNYERAAILFNTERWRLHSIDGIDGLEPNNHINGFGWAEFCDNIVLKSKDGTKEKTIHNTANRIFVGVSNESIHSIAKKSYVMISSNGYIDLQNKNAEHTTAVLVKEPVEFSAIDDDNNDVSDRIKSIEYREPNTLTFKKYPKDGISKTGHIIFRVTTNNGNTRHIKHCYILPEYANVQRNCNKDNGSIILSNIGCMSINGQPVTENNDFRIEDSYTRQPDSSYNTITISDDEYSYEIKVARPFKYRSNLIKQGVIDDHNSTIPILFRKEYSVRVFDDEGVKYLDTISTNTEAVEKLGDYLYSWFKDEEYRKNKKNIKIDDISYTVYTKEIEIDKEFGYFVDKGVDVYENGLKFSFLSLNDNNLYDIELNVKSRREGGKEIKYLTLLMEQYSEVNGIIMQCSSLDPFRCYRPCYKPASTEIKKDNNTKAQTRNDRLEEYAKSLDIASDEISYQHFEAVCKCGGYFGAMDRLLSLSLTFNKTNKGKGSKKRNIISPEDKIVCFYIGYYNYCKANNQTPNYDGLWRMAEEFRFNWLLIPRHIWAKYAKNEDTKMGVVALFRQIPNSSWNYAKLFDRYWELNIPNKDIRTKEFKFLKRLFTDNYAKDVKFPDCTKLYIELDNLNKL